MKNKYLSFIYLVIGLLYAFTLSCSDKEENLSQANDNTNQPKTVSKKENNQIEIFSCWTKGGEADGLKALISIFKQKYPDIEVKITSVADCASAKAKNTIGEKIKNGNPPDSFQVHAGRELIDTWVIADKMEPINFIFKDNKWMDSFPKGLLDVISHYGDIYSVPVNIHRSNVLWYNKKIFKDNRIKPPKSMEDFFRICKLLKSRGITPIAVGDKGVWVASHTFETILLGTLGSEKYNGLWTGGVAWNIPEVKEALKNYSTLMSYANQNHRNVDWQDAAQYVIDGKAAMTIMGDWAEGYFLSKGYKPNKDFGWTPTPGSSDTFLILSDSFSLPKNAPNRDAAIKWLTICASKEGQDAFNPKKGSIPARTDGDLKLYDEYLKSAMDDFKTNKISPSVVHGAAASEGWLRDFNKVIASFLENFDVDKAQKEFVILAKKNLVL